MDEQWIKVDKLDYGGEIRQTKNMNKNGFHFRDVRRQILRKFVIYMPHQVKCDS